MIRISGSLGTDLANAEVVENHGYMAPAEDKVHHKLSRPAA